MQGITDDADAESNTRFLDRIGSSSVDVNVTIQIHSRGKSCPTSWLACDVFGGITLCLDSQVANRVREFHWKRVKLNL